MWYKLGRILCVGSVGKIEIWHYPSWHLQLKPFLAVIAKWKKAMQINTALYITVSNNLPSLNDMEVFCTLTAQYICFVCCAY